MASNDQIASSSGDDRSESQAPSGRSQGPVREEYSFSECDSDEDSPSDNGSDPPPGAPRSRGTPLQVCAYYNRGHCKNGKKCGDLHICKYFLQGKCRSGSECRLRHFSNSESSTDESQSGRRRRRRNRGRRRSSSEDRQASDDGRPYRWQIKSGSRWENIANDHIIEAQYSCPNAKGIRLFNTPFGAISIDFNKMKVLKKKLQVRRFSSSQPGLETEWVWYCSGNHSWIEYGKKDSRGKAAPVNTSTIEKEFQKRQTGSVQFTIDTTKYQIHFQEMRQENLASGQKRKVARRPRFNMPQDGVGSLSSAFQRVAVSIPTWEFEGDSGKWYIFKHRRKTDTESSISSAEIEAKYQRNPQGSMGFTVSGHRYTLDLNNWPLQTSQIQTLT
ncbi:hypothetical protein AAFF_G00077200 [Aldrovandia affinis]|uniref:Uncharacterized protein n=1 Tax=Aldrovandia affinis TaxID=143900 RepID=A0AAD7RXS1_9TELE|nr:hypothetical protein AAFF_G00077200 [Aldrovandia affinis]